MADAYDVMSLAKRSGARVQQIEDWEKYQDELAAAQKKRSKGGFWSDMIGMGTNFLLPMALKAIPGLGAASSIFDLLVKGGATAGLKSLIGSTVRQATGADTKAGAFKSTGTGPYGRAARKQYQRQADLISRGIDEEIAGGKRGRAFMDIAGSLMADKDAWGKALGDLGKGKEAVKGIADVMEGLDPDLVATNAKTAIPGVGAYAGMTEQEALNQLKMGGGGGLFPEGMGGEVASFRGQAALPTEFIETSASAVPSVAELAEFSDPALEQQLQEEYLTKSLNKLPQDYGVQRQVAENFPQELSKTAYNRSGYFAPASVSPTSSSSNPLGDLSQKYGQVNTDPFNLEARVESGEIEMFNLHDPQHSKQSIIDSIYEQMGYGKDQQMNLQELYQMQRRRGGRY